MGYMATLQSLGPRQQKRYQKTDALDRSSMILALSIIFQIMKNSGDFVEITCVSKKIKIRIIVGIIVFKVNVLQTEALKS